MKNNFNKNRTQNILLFGKEANGSLKNEKHAESHYNEIPYVNNMMQECGCERCSLNIHNNERILIGCNPYKRTTCMLETVPISIFINLLRVALITFIGISYVLIKEQPNLPLTLLYTILCVMVICVIFALIKDMNNELLEIQNKNNEEIMGNYEFEEKQQEKNKEVNESQMLLLRLLNDYFYNLKTTINKCRTNNNNNKKVLDEYEEVLKNLENLINIIKTESISINEVNITFMVHLPKLMEYTGNYIALTESNIVDEEFTEEFLRVLTIFNEKINWLIANYKEEDIYKLQALQEVVKVKNENRQ